jgi:hypothetical protein
MKQSNINVNQQESNDMALLGEFNNQMNWFVGEISATTNGTSHDAEAYDTKGRKTIIEHKERKGKTDLYITKYGTVLVEPLKIAHMSKLQAVSGHSINQQRLYINYTDDGVIIFNMNERHHMEYYPSHHHFDPIDGCYKDEDRFGIPVAEAIIYKKIDGRYIRYEG